MIRAEQFCKDAHQELRGERRGKNGLSEAGGMSLAWSRNSWEQEMYKYKWAKDNMIETRKKQ